MPVLTTKGCNKILLMQQKKTLSYFYILLLFSPSTRGLYVHIFTHDLNEFTQIFIKDFLCTVEGALLDAVRSTA